MKKDSSFLVAFCIGLLIAGHGSAQEISCARLLAECGDGPPRTEVENGVTTFLGGGTITVRCVGIISGVLATYQNCSGQMSRAGAAAVLIHFAHTDPKLQSMTGWECAKAAFTNVYACK